MKGFIITVNMLRQKTNCISLRPIQEENYIFGDTFTLDFTVLKVIILRFSKYFLVCYDSRGSSFIINALFITVLMFSNSDFQI